MKGFGLLVLLFAFCIVVIWLVHPLTGAAEDAAVQSTASPYDLDVAGNVQESGSDEISVAFNAEILPTLIDWVNNNLSETHAVTDVASISLDPDQLVLSTDAEVRVYFISEGAGYHNTLGYSEDGGDVTEGDVLIFPDASSAASTYDPSNELVRTVSNPLLPGDFVDLGTIEAGTVMDFFLIANGAFGGTTAYSTDLTSNPDGIVHVVAYALEDSPYLLIGFEDLYGGGDRDYNDLVFVVEIGEANVQKLSGAPEPSTLLILSSLVLPAYVVRRRRRAFSGKGTE